MNNLELMRQRLNHFGGEKQQSRMINDKYRSFLAATNHSYQAAQISVEGRDLKNVPALINPNKVKQDYDDKILSIGFEADTKPGTIIKWEGTDSYWLVYLQELTELAYFKGDIRRCKYQINWKDENEKVHSIRAAIRGPVETKINSIQKSQISLDVPNLSLNILIPNNEDSKKAFKRYKRFLFSGCAWEVQTIDWISMDGVLEITALEYYIKTDSDDLENEVANGLEIKPIDPNVPIEPLKPAIVGETFIKPLFDYQYEVKDISFHGTWSLKSKSPVMIVTGADNKICLTWNKTISGQFTLLYTIDDITLEKIIVVESLF